MERTREERMVVNDVSSHYREERAFYRVFLVGILLGSIMGIGGTVLYRQSAVEAQPVSVGVDLIRCQAKFDNWMDRWDEVHKPKMERYQSFREYNDECLKLAHRNKETP